MDACSAKATVNQKDDRIYVLVLEDNRPKAVSVLGVVFFKENWVEFDLDKKQIAFSDPTSWSHWSECKQPTSLRGEAKGKRTVTQQTRKCLHEDTKWCPGSSSRPCGTVSKPTPPASPCPHMCINEQSCDYWTVRKAGYTCDYLETSHGCDCHGCACIASTDGQLAWSEWSACSVTCGRGIQGRGATRVAKASTGAGVMRQPEGLSMRSCQRNTCPKSTGTKSTDSTCFDPSCVSFSFCISCQSNDFKSCTSCHKGCTLRKIDSDDHHDCKGS